MTKIIIPGTGAQAVTELHEAGVPIVTTNSKEEPVGLNLEMEMSSKVWSHHDMAP